MTAAALEFEHGPTAWCIVVHGGAGPTSTKAHAEGCERAANAAREILAAGGTALDAVERAVIVLEDDPLFNAGTGACLDTEGNVALDASIMDGALRGGAVCALPPFKNPIAIARAVMEKTRHVLLAGEGAARFAVANGFTAADPSSMITEHARKRLADAKAQGKKSTSGGTVGAVARDLAGHVAAATSTGGVVDKLPGRVGDSAILGAGTYADDERGACSTTGHGEAMIRVGLARAVVEGARDLGATLVGALEAMQARTQGTGGAIAISRDGAIAVARTTPAMSWASSYYVDGADAALRSSAS